jgi:RHS repeat-associated protein
VISGRTNYVAADAHYSVLGVTRSATNLLTLGFAYDAAVNLTTLSDATNLGYARNNSFDLFDRIQTSNSPSNTAANENFAYKGIGDFSNKTGATFNYDASTRRLASISAANALYSRAYSYDLYGNATGDGRFNYEYDAYSNLRKSKQLSGATIAEYTYDGLNHLAKKTTPTPPNGNVNLATVHYLYTGAGKLFGEYPASSTGSAGGKEYIYASGKMVGQSVRGGASANPISGNGTGPLNNTWYIGKAQDATTGLVYFGARWFDPQVARFMGFDPADVDEENPHSFNRYAYGNNNPYKYLDPDGRNPALVAAGMSRAAAPAVGLGNYVSPNPTPSVDPALGVHINPSRAPEMPDIGGFLANVNKAIILISPISIVDKMASIITSIMMPVKDLKILHSEETLGARPDLSKLSDKQLLDSVKNPTTGEKLTVNPLTGNLVNGNSRARELQRRSTDPKSSIKPDTQVPVDKHVPDRSMFED